MFVWWIELLDCWYPISKLCRKQCIENFRKLCFRTLMLIEWGMLRVSADSFIQWLSSCLAGLGNDVILLVGHLTGLSWILVLRIQNDIDPYYWFWSLSANPPHISDEVFDLIHLMAYEDTMKNFSIHHLVCNNYFDWWYLPWCLQGLCNFLSFLLACESHEVLIALTL